MSKNIAVLGAQWGDEGKGRIVHWLSPNYDWIVRFNGGANAGHTIYRDGIKYVHNLMPSFDWRHEKTKVFLASGMVIDLEQLHKEVKLLWDVNPSIVSRIYVDPDAFLVLPEHKNIDKKMNAHIGSTNRGIGPAYTSKISRQGLTIRDRMNDLNSNTDKLFILEMQKMGVTFSGMLELRNRFKQESILFEGAQGVMLDINHGTYPYVSCSECTVAGIYSCGFHFAKLDNVYGVAKCYTTKVGEGPFPAELSDEEAASLRTRGNEYGATTGRPRRIGWLDVPALNYACQKGGITDLILTKFDILNGMSSVPVCARYDTELTCAADFFKVKPEYINLPGWQDAAQIEQLSQFLQFIEKNTNCKVRFVSYGVGEEDISKL